MEKKMKLKANPEYEKLVPPMTAEEYTALKESLKKDGQWYPIIINKNWEILDGKNRYTALQELGIEPRWEVREFPDIIAEKEFVITVNLKRRHLTFEQRAFLGVKLLELEKERAKERQLAGVSIEKQDTLAHENAKVEKGKASEKVAMKVNVSPRTIEKAKVIEEEGSEELKTEVKEGKTSISKAYAKIKGDKEAKEKPTEEDSDLQKFLTEYKKSLKETPEMPMNLNNNELLLRALKAMIENNGVCCKVCGCKTLKWECGHDL
jgi:ParB-like chromosome segregation protein Spo0J